jgi:hypothetical protein
MGQTSIFCILYEEIPVLYNEQICIPHNTESSKKFVHCNENPIYIFPEKELSGLSPNFHIHVSLGDLYITGLPILLQENMWTDPRNI